MSPAANPKALHVLIAGRPAGVVTETSGGRLSFRYAPDYRSGDLQIPLSLSMPLSGERFGHEVIEPFLWNLLPENQAILERWGRTFQCSPNNAFRLIAGAGEDCAGAVQFLTDAVVERLTGGSVTWLDEADIARRLAALRRDAAAGRRLSDPGQFSLAGVQAKTAYCFDDTTRRWGIPSGRLPTTHILKPPIPGLNGHVENEHFCLRLAAAAGLTAARSDVRWFGDEQAIVVERYDRLPVGGQVVRIHQEDMCQALGVPPTAKYQAEDGLGVARIMTGALTRSTAPETDRARFMEALVFNFIIGGSDAHAKNYSMLLGPQSSARLAPLYDLASILPHLGEGDVQAEFRAVRMAMKVGSKYRFSEIMPRHWEATARECRFSADHVHTLLRHHLATLPGLAAEVAADCRAAGLSHDVLVRLPVLIEGRCKELIPVYGAEVAAEEELPGRK